MNNLQKNAVAVALNVVAGADLKFIGNAYCTIDEENTRREVFAKGADAVVNYYDMVSVTTIDYSDINGTVVSGSKEELEEVTDAWTCWPVFFNLFNRAITLDKNVSWGFHTDMESLTAAGGRSAGSEALYKTIAGLVKIDKDILIDILELEMGVDVSLEKEYTNEPDMVVYSTKLA